MQEKKDFSELMDTELQRMIRRKRRDMKIVNQVLKSSREGKAYIASIQIRNFIIFE